MVRFIEPSPNGGIPYANTDFFIILQTEHLKSYRSHLDAINDVPLISSATSSRGIVMNGCEVANSIPPGGNYYDFDFTYTLSVANVSSFITWLNTAFEDGPVTPSTSTDFLTFYLRHVSSGEDPVIFFISPKPGGYTNITDFINWINSPGKVDFSDEWAGVQNFSVTPDGLGNYVFRIKWTPSSILYAGSNWTLTYKEFFSGTSFYRFGSRYPWSTPDPSQNFFFTAQSQPSLVTSGSGTCEVDFRNSMVYLPGLTGGGDFLEPEPSIATSPIQLPYTNFWLIPVTSSTIDERRFITGLTYTTTVTTYFGATSVNPGSSIPNIQFLEGDTNRRYKRIMRYSMDRVGDVFITSTTSNFDTLSGLGFGDKFGYALCDGQNGTFNLKGRYVIGYDDDTVTSPENNTFEWGGVGTTDPVAGQASKSQIMNYGKIGNIGGGYSQSGVVQPSSFSQLPKHTHSSGTFILQNNENPDGVPSLEHYHNLNHSQKKVGAQPTRINHFSLLGGKNNFPKEVGISNVLTNVETANITYISRAGQSIPSLSENFLGSHTHSIYSNFGRFSTNDASPITNPPFPHEARPPYTVLVYYQKIQL